MKQSENAKKVRYIVSVGLLAAILLIGQVGMAFLPNIEPVTTLLILYTLTYKKHVFPIIYTFVLLEGVIYGFGLWWINYLYVWSILALVVLAFQKIDSAVLWAVIAGAFGLSFGALCAVPYLIAGGTGAAFVYWTNGIPYDVLHCCGNFVLTLILYKPLLKILRKYVVEDEG